MIQMSFQKFPSGPLGTNAILFACPQTKIAAVIDPSSGSAIPILRQAEREGVAIKKILLTHSHWDHIADAHSLIEKTGAEIYVHPLDAGNLEHPGSDGIPLFFPIRGVHPDCTIQDGDRIFVGGIVCEVIHTPGHSPGSVCFFVREQNLLFSGDTLFEGTYGSLQLPTAEPEKMQSSLKKLAQLSPDTQVVPGHGGNTTIGKENWLNREIYL